MDREAGVPTTVSSDNDGEPKKPIEMTRIVPGTVPGAHLFISEKQKKKVEQKVEAKRERTVFAKDRKFE